MMGTVSRPQGAVSTRQRGVSHRQHACVVALGTELNWMAFAWQNDAVLGIVFGYPSQRQAEAALLKSLRRAPGTEDIFRVRGRRQLCRFVGEDQVADEPRWVDKLVQHLRQFAEGEPVDFSEVPLALEHLTPFARRVVAACRRIPWGQVRTYGQLAAVCGSPGAARAVGSVMAKNRYPLVVPCHRVVGAGGSLGGYSAPQGLRMKRRLLAMEGVSAFAAAK